MLVRKFYVMTIIFFMLMSNLFSGLASAVSFIFQNSDINFQGVSIGSQYNFVKNAPKDFVNLCVNISKEAGLFNIIREKSSNITADKNLKNFTDEFLLTTSGFKFKSAKMTERVFANGGINISQGSIIFYLFMVILIFYLIGYIGLLRVFNDSFCINKNELTVKLCL